MALEAVTKAKLPRRKAQLVRSLFLMEELIKMIKNKTTWVELYNCLYIVSSNYKDISHLASPIFAIFEELDTSIRMGLSENSLSFFLAEEWIDVTLKSELGSFRDFLNSIEAKNWNPDAFDYFDDWEIARKWAKQLMGKLKMEGTGWNSDGEVVIYTK